jgi:hypothetical protein
MSTQAEQQPPSPGASSASNPGLARLILFFFLATLLFGIFSILLNIPTGLAVVAFIFSALGTFSSIMQIPGVLKYLSKLGIRIPPIPPGLPSRLLRIITGLLILGVLVLDGVLIWLLTHPPNVLPQNFVVTSLHPGQVIQDQDVPLTIRGTYSSEGSDRVWVVLEDNQGQYYLQTPPVEFLGGGQWVAHNIRPGQGITQVDFVQVTSDGNSVFQQMVDSGDFGAFNQLPDGSTILVSIPIVSQVSG